MSIKATNYVIFRHFYELAYSLPDLVLTSRISVYVSTMLRLLTKVIYGVKVILLQVTAPFGELSNNVMEILSYNLAIELGIFILDHCVFVSLVHFIIITNLVKKIEKKIFIVLRIYLMSVPISGKPELYSSVKARNLLKRLYRHFTILKMLDLYKRYSRS